MKPKQNKELEDYELEQRRREYEDRELRIYRDDLMLSEDERYCQILEEQDGICYED
jgi:hypothetical protein